MAENKVKIGFIGVGNIHKQYMQGVGMYPILEVAMLADLNVELAKQKAAEYNVPKAGSVEEMLADPEIELVINLTIPNVHSAVSIAAINAGKHVYSEKPLGVTRAEGKAVIDAANAKGVLVGCAPDTFLGGGLQTCRYLIDSGAIGTPVAATAFMAGHGPESWHPNPFFYYAKGGGPVLDMGPYYLTALVHLLGPARRMAASTRMTFPERIATSQMHNGTKIPVEVTTHSTSVIDFQSGAIATMIMSFDIWAHHLPRIEIYGSEGTLSVPDPNTFGGPVSIKKAGESDWHEFALTHESKMLRGVGPADMAYAIRTGRPHRASGQMAYHVLDMMCAFDDSSEQGKHITLSTTCDQPAALPMGLALGQLD
ncbi:MAG: Gfo/Idh/MocA family oxidoreductase [Anaerolineae bacterium]|nr:Gfo/Idh/MocA family oxidoreductase [Anaerolineae bacterium]